ncbi:uncharacterized protein LOC130083252 [Rhinichthys klamathensis goyatoka]|uniref:uncharacterized protein LOC130083252 n=1 Tax=Rhinichthys klamathensis goyatoka TaxID=3034132 RepID=UPI0024B534EA|nr:uncharacterized protein LOC130083252 [Rhinichthys klamathensis goyatoka]
MDSIAKTTQSLTTAEDMRNQTKLIMKPYANWEEYLTPAPLSIAILGELVFISSATDFSINNNLPEGGYKYIKHPDSFRACLMQVCNSGWWAFNEAHNNMDQIRLHTARVPDYMKQAVKILFQGDDEVVKAHLPNQLESIKVIADECLKLSEDTKDYFSVVIGTIHELLEVCMSAQNFYGEEMEEIKKKLDEAKLRKQSAEDAKKRTQKLMDAMEKQMKEAQEEYHRAMASLPSGWDMIGMDFVSGITESMTRMVDGMLIVMTQQAERYGYSATKSNDNTEGNIKDQGNTIDLVAEITPYSKSGEIVKYVQKLEEEMKVNCEDDEIDWTNLYDQKNTCTTTDYIKEQFERISTGLKDPDCPAKTEAQKLCHKGMEICNQLAKYAPDGKCDKDKSNEIKGKVLDLIKSARDFDCKSKKKTHSPAISPKPPMMQKEENKSGHKRPSQQATDNARFAIEQTRAQLNNTSETYENYAKSFENNQKELTDILVTMRNCKVKEINFKDTIAMLAKGMDAMGRVGEQWAKMVRFFQMVSTIVKCSLSTTLTDFVSTSEDTQTLSYNAKLFSIDQLYTQASKACNIASLVHMISGTYTEISDKYLMDRVSSLSKLMAMDKSKPEFLGERLKFECACNEAQKGILMLVLENKKEFEKKSTARIEKIDRELLAILPAVPPENIKMIEDSVKAAFCEEDEASSYY